MTNFTELKKLKEKVGGGDMGSLPEYLSALIDESLSKLLVCDAKQLQYYQSRHKCLTEIKTLIS